jgi:hypothetical protein
LNWLTLAVDIPQIRAGRDAAVDPATRSNLRYEVARLLHVLPQNRNHRCVLLAEELLRDRATLLAHAHLLGVLEEGLEVLVATAARHIRNREEGTGLRTDLAAVRLETWLVAHEGIGVNGDVVVAVPLPRIDEELVDGDRVDTTGVGDEVGRHVATGADRLRIVGLDAAEVVTGVSHPIDIEIGRLHPCRSGSGSEKEQRSFYWKTERGWVRGTVCRSVSAGVSKRYGKL